MFLIHDHPPANTWWVSPRWQWAKDPSLWSQDKLGLVFKSFWFRSEGVRPADLQFYESEIKFNSGTPELKKKQTSLTPSTCHPLFLLQWSLAGGLCTPFVNANCCGADGWMPLGCSLGFYCFVYFCFVFFLVIPLWASCSDGTFQGLPFGNWKHWKLLECTSHCRSFLTFPCDFNVLTAFLLPWSSLGITNCTVGFLVLVCVRNKICKFVNCS